MGLLDHQDHTLRYHSLGQAPLVLFRSGQDPRWLPASTVPLGLLPDPPMPEPEPIRFQTGDVFVVLSDGFFEYANGAGEEFGRDRVAAAFTAEPDLAADDLIHRLEQQLDAFADGAPQEDDLTALVIKRRGAA